MAAGPIFDVDKQEGDPVGSMVIFNAERPDEVQDFINGDPYHQAGLFDSIFTSQLAKLDVTGQHCDPYFDVGSKLFQPLDYDPVHDKMMELGLVGYKKGIP